MPPWLAHSRLRRTIFAAPGRRLPGSRSPHQSKWQPAKVPVIARMSSSTARASVTWPASARRPPAWSEGIGQKTEASASRYDASSPICTRPSAGVRGARSSTCEARARRARSESHDRRDASAARLALRRGAVRTPTGSEPRWNSRRRAIGSSLAPRATPRFAARTALLRVLTNHSTSARRGGAGHTRSVPRGTGAPCSAATRTT